jgi:ferritin
MLISKKLNAAINEQIGNEFGASLQYLAIASYLESESLPFLSARFFAQAQEEHMHAMKFLKYILNAGGKVEIPSISAPRSEIKSVEEAVRLSVEWEYTVTKQVNSLVTLAIKEGDYIAQNFLAWFTTEQLEEVSSMETLLKVVQRAGDNLVYVEQFLAQKSSGPAKASAETGNA